MTLTTHAMRAALVLAILAMQVHVSGCAGQGPGSVPRLARATDDTVEICVRRATTAQCSRVAADDYAEEIEMYRDDPGISEDDW